MSGGFRLAGRDRRIRWLGMVLNRICVGFAAFALTAVLSCGGGGGPRELKLSLILGENSDWYRGALKFKELVENRTGGRYRVRLYPHAQLAGNQRTELEMLQSGVIDLSLESSILLSLVEPRMSVLSLPWLFDDYEEAEEVCDGPLGSGLLDLLPPKGIVGLAYGVNGFRQLTNSRLPVEEPADLQGLKIRIPGIRMYIDVFKHFGADPSSMNFAEVFTALAQGTMDGQENPLSVIFSARLYEVQKYLTLWNYSYDPVILCMNKGLWDSLNPGDRGIFTACAREAMSYERKLVSEGEAALLDSLRNRGMVVTVLSPEALDEFKRMVEPVYSELSGEIGGDVVDRFRGAAE